MPFQPLSPSDPMHLWFKTHEDLPTFRLVILYFCVLLTLQGPVGHLTLSYSLGWGLILNQIGIMVVPVLILCRTLEMDMGTLFPFRAIPRHSWRWLILSTLSVIFLSDILLGLTEYLLPIPTGIQETLDHLLMVHGPGEFLKKLFLFCLLPAVAEEFFFRGFCQTTFEHRIGITPAILLSALLFALAHGNMWYLHLYFGLGCFLGWIYAKSNSLWPVIAAHFLNNTWTFMTHMMGLDITTLPITAALGIAVLSVLGLGWGIRRWQLESVAR